MNERPLVDELSDEHVSAARRYLRWFVGKESWWAFVRYESVTCAVGSMPGALGYLLRSQCYPWLLRRVGRGSVFGRHMVIRSPGRIAIGDHVMMDDHVVLDAKGSTSSIELGSRILVGRHTILSCHDASITIGDRVSIGPFCCFASKRSIAIGSCVSIGSGVQLMAGTHAFDDLETPIIQQTRISKGIVVEDNVWLGMGAKILDGVTIGRNSIVGVDSVVSRDVAPGTVVLGNPARVIQQRKAGSAE